MCCGKAGMRYRRCPQDRWDVEEFYDPDPDAPGKIVTRRAGFIDDVIGFDASFFGVSAREARWIDPQHRLLLETAWQAVEHSGTAPSALANTKTGVFMGLSTHDYLGMISDELSYAEIEAYLAIGTSAAAGSGPDQLSAGAAGPGGLRRHGVQLVVGGSPSGVPGAALRANVTSRWPAA